MKKKLNIGDDYFSDFILKPISQNKPQLNDVDFDHQKSGLDHHPQNQTKCQVILQLYLKPLSQGLKTVGAM